MDLRRFKERGMGTASSKGDRIESMISQKLGRNYGQPITIKCEAQ
jgi:hypothetical protein